MRLRLLALPETGRLISTYQKRLIVNAPRLVFYYVEQKPGGIIPNTQNARRWAVEKRGATHFDCFAFHRFNLHNDPCDYKVGDFYCTIIANNAKYINNNDIFRFIIDLLIDSLRLCGPSSARLIYLGELRLGLTIPAKFFGIEDGGEFLPYLYRAAFVRMLDRAAKLHVGRFDIQYHNRVDVENKSIGPDRYAVPFRLGEIDLDSHSFLDNLSRTPRAAPDAKWDQIIGHEILSELRSEASLTRLQDLKRAKKFKWSEESKLRPLTVPTGASACSQENIFSAVKCACKLVAWISKKGIVEFGRRDALRAVDGSERLHGKSGRGGGVADALDILVAYDYVQKCPFPPIDYPCKRPSPWYEVNPILHRMSTP
jgi:hypothetical protein